MADFDNTSNSQVTRIWEMVFLKTLSELHREGISGELNETEIRLVQKWGKNHSLLMINTQSAPPFSANNWCGLVLTPSDVKKLITILTTADNIFCMLHHNFA